MAKRSTGSGTSRARSKKNHSLDAIQMLEADHRKVKKLFADFNNGDLGHQERIALEIFHELEVHSILEEELFYPALHDQDLQLISGLREESDLNGKDVLAEEQVGNGVDAESYSEAGEVEENENNLSGDAITSAYEDHRVVRDLITRLRQMNPSAPEFRQHMVELQDMVADHVSIEEEELFPEAQINLDVKMLGQQMQERKADILSEAA